MEVVVNGTVNQSKRKSGLGNERDVRIDTINPRSIM